MAETADDSSRGTTIFVLGLLSIFMCQILGPVAWMMGNGYRAECIERGNEMNQLGSVGRILGMVGTGLFIFNLVIVGFVFLIYGAMFVAIIAGEM